MSATGGYADNHTHQGGPRLPLPSSSPHAPPPHFRLAVSFSTTPAPAPCPPPHPRSAPLPHLIPLTYPHPGGTNSAQCQGLYIEVCMRLSGGPSLYAGIRRHGCRRRCEQGLPDARRRRASHPLHLSRRHDRNLPLRLQMLCRRGQGGGRGGMGGGGAGRQWPGQHGCVRARVSMCVCDMNTCMCVCMCVCTCVCTCVCVRVHVCVDTRVHSRGQRVRAPDAAADAAAAAAAADAGRALAAAAAAPPPALRRRWRRRPPPPVWCRNQRACG